MGLPEEARDGRAASASAILRKLKWAHQICMRKSFISPG